MTEMEVFIFVHPPKTGGKSFRDHFLKHLRYHSEFVHLAKKGLADARSVGLPAFEDRPKDLRR